MPVHIFLYFTSECCLARNSSDHNVKWAIPFHEWHPPKEDIGFHRHPPPLIFWMFWWLINYPNPPPLLINPSHSPGLKTATPPSDFYFFDNPYHPPTPTFFPIPTPRFLFFVTLLPSPLFFSHPPGGRELKKIYGGGVINWGLGWGVGGGWGDGSGGRGWGMGWGAEQRSARQLCAANLWHTEQCTTTVRSKLAAHIVYQNECATIVCRKLAAHIVCQDSARQLCAAYLWRTLCARTVRQKSNLHTKNAFAANAPQL